jgi:hypothetical protein
VTGLGLVDYTMRGNLIDLIVTEVGRSVGGKEMPRERSYATGVRGCENREMMTENDEMRNDGKK